MNKQDEDKVPDIKKDGWEADKLVRESANQESDEVVQKILRGDESKGNTDDKNIVETPDSKDTPQERQEKVMENEAEDDQSAN